MDCTKEKSFVELAREAGFGGCVFMRPKDVGDLLGISESTVRKEIDRGRLKHHLPAGRVRGKLVHPEWVDEWIREGTHENG